jgi:hypothetical protein
MSIEQAWAIERRTSAKLARDLLEIARHAMPGTFFQSDSRCQHARRVLERFKKEKANGRSEKEG